MEWRNLFICILSLTLAASGYGQDYLSAEESDPGKMGWMQGFPPDPDRVISAIDGSFFRFPALRYSVCHMREFFPTVRVASSKDSRYRFKEKPNRGIDSVRFIPYGSSTPMTWHTSLRKNYTDGMIILHKGRIVYERYFGALDRVGIHAAMSVSKTFTGTLGALLVAEGVLDEDALCSDYVPELRNSGFGDATVRQVLDMTTSIQYSENYADPNAEIWDFGLAGNPFPKPEGYDGPANYFDYLKTVQKQHRHGDAFAYKTVNTDVMGWIISRVLDKPLDQVLSERIWKPIGAHYDGYYQIDGSGIAFAGGGFNANLRDMAAFGEMIRNNGFFNKKQILPEDVIKDIQKGGDPKLFEKSGYGLLKGWSYRNMWWVTHNEHGAFAARGVHGQTIYIDPVGEMVIVRLASHPVAGNAANDPYSLPAYHAVARYLMGQ